MNATFRQLGVFLALAEHGSITAAARACHVTQPTVSMQLKELSEAVGLPLYEQIGKSLYLTPAGEALADTAHAIAGEWERFEQTIAAMQGHTKGRLRVSLASTAEYFVPRILGSFCARYPEIDISLEIVNRVGVLQRLRANADDVYIMSIPPTDIELVLQPFIANPLVVIAPISHPLARRRQLKLEELSEEPFILREAGSGTRMSCDAHFARAGFTPKVRLQLGSNEAIKQAVAGGLGLSVLSAHALGSHIEDDALTVLQVEGFPIGSKWSALYPKGKQLSPIARVFLQHLETTARELSAQERS